MFQPQIKQLIIDGSLVTGYIRPAVSTKTPITFLHGWRCDSSIWFRVAELMQPDRTIVLLDLPGFGKSEIPPKPYNMADFTGITGKFLDKIGIRKTVVVGHSFGGSIGIYAAATVPSRVGALVLVDSSGVRPPTLTKKTYRNLAKLVKPLFKPAFMQTLRKKIYIAIGSEDYVASPQLTQTYKKIITEDLSLLLNRIKCPTLIIWGRDDRETPRSLGETLNAGIAGSQLELMSGDHFPFVGDPPKFAEILNQFLERI